MKPKTMKKIITTPQMSDMGSGFGYIEGATGRTLEEVLDWYANNTKTWGVICIYQNNDIIRKFDYNTHSDNIFYHHLSGWEYKLSVKEVKFNYCFMGEDINIYLK